MNGRFGTAYGEPPPELDGLRSLGVRVRLGPGGAFLVAIPEAGEGLVRSSLATEGLVVRQADALEWELAADSAPKQIERALRLALAPELLCLDVDGTIVDNGMSLLATIRATLVELTGRSMYVGELLAARRSGVWKGDEHFVAEMCARCGREVSPAEVERVMDSLYFSGPGGPGFAELERVVIRGGLLQKLGERFALALVTSRSRAKLAAICPRLGLPDAAIVVCCDDVTHDKPDPEGIRLALTLTERRYAWMIGDRGDDMLAARRAGALAIGVGPNQAELEAAGAALVLSDINQLDGLLAGLPSRAD